MPQLKIIDIQTQTETDMVDTTYGDSIEVDGAQTYSAQCTVDVNTPSAKTFNSGVAASLIVQDLTYTADLNGTAGNSITIAYTGGGTAGAEVVSVVGSAISVQIQNATSTATQIKTAVDASVAASALISVAITGTGSNAQNTAAATPLASGTASTVNTSNGNITIASHGLTTGLKGQLTSTGTLPTGLSLATDYFIISIDTNTVRFASSLANAQAGTAITPSTQGTSGAVNTFTSTAIAGASVTLQESNDDTNYSDVASATSITADAVLTLKKVDPECRYYRLKFAITAGRMSSSNVILTKGLN
jgi:hypothetical protein